MTRYETTVRSSHIKAILGSAALFGMTGDLDLSVVDTSVDPPRTDTSRLSWATSIFYFGQLAGSYPMTYTLQLFPTRYVLGPAVMVWAVICAATAGVSTWRGLFAQRFFLGTFQFKVMKLMKASLRLSFPLDSWSS